MSNKLNVHTDLVQIADDQKKDVGTSKYILKTLQRANTIIIKHLTDKPCICICCGPYFTR